MYLRPFNVGAHRDATRSVTLASVLVLTLACGNLDGSASAPSQEELRELHGLVQLGLSRGEAEASDPYQGTSRIEITLEYDTCIETFYADNPEYRIRGEFGAKVFGSAKSEWFDACRGTEGIVCEVTEIRQSLATSDAASPGLTVVYAVAGHLEGRALGFGPIPSEQLSECSPPTMHLVSLDAILGLDDAGVQLWKVVSANPLNARVGEVGDTIDVSAVRTAK